MNQQEILKKVGGIIAELKDQYNYLEAAENGFNDLELELFMANANFLTDHIGILQKINYQSVQALLSSSKPVLQLDEVSPKPQIPDYFDGQELLSAEKGPLQIRNPSVEIIEPPLQEIEKPQEIIILPEAMPQTEPAEISVEDASFIDPKSVSEPDLHDASFIDLKSVSEPDLHDASFIEPKSVSKPDLDNASFIDQKLASEPDLHDASFTDPKLVSEPDLHDASFIDPKSVSEPDLQSNIFKRNEVETVRDVPEPETISLNMQQGRSGFDQGFHLHESSQTNSTEPAILTLNDRIAAQKGLDQPKSKTENKPKTVQDLQSMISLNDKLLFVKELFNGYNLAYAEAVNILNRYSNFEQAEQFLKLNYTAKNNWKDKPITVEKFMDLLRKRLS